MDPPFAAPVTVGPAVSVYEDVAFPCWILLKVFSVTLPVDKSVLDKICCPPLTLLTQLKLIVAELPVWLTMEALKLGTKLDAKITLVPTRNSATVTIEIWYRFITIIISHQIVSIVSIVIKLKARTSCGDTGFII
jgi:hypothetical protein